jgi:hypothetical protein
MFKRVSCRSTINGVAGHGSELPEKLPNYRDTVFMTDGGVRDNLGLAPILEINRLRTSRKSPALPLYTFVSDGGRTYDLDSAPSGNWLFQCARGPASYGCSAFQVLPAAEWRYGKGRSEMPRDFGERTGGPRGPATLIIKRADGPDGSALRVREHPAYARSTTLDSLVRQKAGNGSTKTTSSNYRDSTPVSPPCPIAFRKGSSTGGILLLITVFRISRFSWTDAERSKRLNVCALPYKSTGLAKQPADMASYGELCLLLNKE